MSKALDDGVDTDGLVGMFGGKEAKKADNKMLKKAIADTDRNWKSGDNYIGYREEPSNHSHS